MMHFRSARFAALARAGSGRSRQRPPTKVRGGERGWLLISMAMTLVVASILGVIAYREQAAKDGEELANGQADVVKSIRDAANTLVLERYVEYQKGQPITRNGVTLAAGDDVGESFSPTVAQLRTMALGIEGISDRGSLNSLSDAGYLLRINRIPAGCEAVTGGSTCNITGLVCFDRPLRNMGEAGDNIDGTSIGHMLARIGGDAGASLSGVAPGEILGYEAGWRAANPIDDAPPGIFCARFGFGSSGFANFLRVRDERDPEFQNNVTIAQGINVQQTATVNASCAGTAEGVAVWGEVNGAPVWLRCEAGTWTPGNGITYANAGDACTVDGAFAMTPGGIALVCSNGHWVSQDSKGLRTAAYYQHGSTVPVPACGVGLNPSAVIAAVAASNIIGINNNGNNTGSFQASINASWQVTVTGADGSPAGTSATALIFTFCNP